MWLEERVVANAALASVRLRRFMGVRSPLILIGGLGAAQQ